MTAVILLGMRILQEPGNGGGQSFFNEVGVIVWEPGRKRRVGVAEVQGIHWAANKCCLVETKSSQRAITSLK